MKEANPVPTNLPFGRSDCSACRPPFCWRSSARRWPSPSMTTSGLGSATSTLFTRWLIRFGRLWAGRWTVACSLGMIAGQVVRPTR